MLADGGVFLTQQVSPDDKKELKEAFGRGQNYGLSVDPYLERLEEKLLSTGFGEIELDHYWVKEYFRCMEDLEFLLRNTPIIQDFGGERDRRILEEFVEDNRTERGILIRTCRAVAKGCK